MMLQQTLVMFAIFVAITLVVTYWASGQSTTSRGFYAADRRIGGFQNGWAIAGDYVSAATFLGITGLVAFYGFDGFMYSVGWLVAYLAVLFLVAEPLRNAGKYTLADLISFRLRGLAVKNWSQSLQARRYASSCARQNSVLLFEVMLSL